MRITQNLRANPYVGPRAFQDGEKLYGRDREVQDLLDLLIAERIVLLYSPSGAGKTSLIQAALCEELRKERFQVLRVIRVNQELLPSLELPPNVNRYILSVLLSLEEALPAELRRPVAELANMQLVDYLDRRPTTVDKPADQDLLSGLLSLTKVLPAAWSQPMAESANTRREEDLDRLLPEAGKPGDQVLIFDQFEEILTVDPHNQAAKAEFFAQVGAALRNPRRWALFSMREDYLAGLDPYLRPIPTRLSNTFRLDLLGESCALQAVQQPARERYVEFSDGAAKKLIDDLRRVRVQRPDGTLEEQLGLYVEPVQLQVVCRRVWEKLPEDVDRIVEADVAAVGDVDRALADYYADQVATIAAATHVHERDIREWFDCRLITEQGIRGQVQQGPEQSGGLDNRAIGPLVDAHRVRAEKRLGAFWFELAHDRLIEPVRASNAAWRDANLGPLQRQAALWEKQNRPSGLLLRDQALVQAERWDPDKLTPIEREFLAACQAARTQQRRERRKNRIIAGLAVVATIISVFALIALCVGLGFFLQYQEQARLATARELAAAANDSLSVDPERSILLALRAAAMTEEDKTVIPEAQDALQRAVQASRVEQTLVGHKADVLDVAYSPDGKRVATASDDDTARVWDAASGKELLSITANISGVLSLAFSPDGTRLATSGWNGITVVWDTRSGEKLRTLTGHRDGVAQVAYSPNGTRIATASYDRTVKMWDATSGKELFTLQHINEVHGVAFSPDGTRLATASGDRTAKVWDATSGKELFTLSGHTDEVVAVAFSPDGTRIATASLDNTAKVWDVTSEKQLFTLSGHTNSVFGVAFSPHGTRIATASADGTAKVWDADSGQELLTLSGHANVVGNIAYSPDGTRVATASWDGTAKVWNAEAGHTARVVVVNFSPDGRRVATASHDHTAKIWDAASNTVLFTLRHADEVNSIVFSKDGTRVATASADRTAKIWDAASGKELRTLSGHSSYIYDAVFSPDGTRITTASDDSTARIWDATSGKELFTLQHDGPVLHAVFSPDGSLVATASRDGTARVWDATSGEELHRLYHDHDSWVFKVAFSPDGKRLATAGSDATARVWDAATGEELRMWYHTDEKDIPFQVTGVAFSPDGAHLVTSGLHRAAVVWDIAPNKEVRRVGGHSNWIEYVVFSSDGTRMATASTDKTARVWDAATGKELLILSHTAEVLDVAFSPDGTRLATASSDKKMHIYPLNIEDLLALARSRVTRSLRPEECQKYLHQQQCPPTP